MKKKLKFKNIFNLWTSQVESPSQKGVANEKNLGYYFTGGLAKLGLFGYICNNSIKATGANGSCGSHFASGDDINK